MVAQQTETTPNSTAVAPNAEVILRATDIESGYGGSLIVKGVSMYTRAREIVTIIGPNGAGKSTMLKAIFGLIPTYKGRVELLGRDITKTSPSQIVKQGAAFVPQTHNVFESLSIMENLEMGGITRKRGIRKRAKEILQMFPELERRPREKAGRLSGGQRQTLALGRALMLDPKLLVLDEPTAALSPKIIDEIFERIEKIRQTGVAILMVEQNATYALKISNRGYLMVDGEVALEQEASEMLANPDVGRMFLGH